MIDVRFSRLVGCMSLCAVALVVGCASEGQKLSSTIPPTEEQVAKTVQAVEPTLPLATQTLGIEASAPEPVSEPAKEKKIEAGSFASVVKKLEDNPLTLYFRGDESYRFYLGGTAEATYKPGDGLLVREDKDDALVCQFAENGSLNLPEKITPDKASQQKEACSTLMFAVDQALTP